MAGETVALASDHAGFELKQLLKVELEAMGYTTLDLGTNGSASVDYPDFGFAAAEAVASGRAAKGVIVCGSGIGISIAANRHPGARAALCHDVTTARLCRLHNDANILALGARITGIETARDILQQFFATAFEGGRHANRVAKLGKAPVHT